MPLITSHQSLTSTKLLLIGDSSSGKTGALASLAAAGYRLRIIDLDNGLDILKSYLTDPKSPYVKANPECAKNVHFVTAVDPMRNVAGKLFPSKSIAWAKAIGMLAEWKETEPNGTVTSLGKITEWTDQDILVIDSLTRLSDAALNYHLSLNAGLGQDRSGYEGQRDIGAAQKYIRSLLEMLSDPSIKCNVIVSSHITFVSEGGVKPAPDAKGSVESPGQGYPSAIGRALSPHIPRYFNSMLIAKIEGSGNGARRRIYTSPQMVGTQSVGAKSSAPLNVAPFYPLESGLADYFKAVRG
jgi:hypothetical protein